MATRERAGREGIAILVVHDIEHDALRLVPIGKVLISTSTQGETPMLKTLPCRENHVSVQPPLSQIRMGAAAWTIRPGREPAHELIMPGFPRTPSRQAPRPTRRNFDRAPAPRQRGATRAVADSRRRELHLLRQGEQ